MKKVSQPLAILKNLLDEQTPLVQPEIAQAVSHSKSYYLPLRMRVQPGQYLFVHPNDILLIEAQERYIKIYFDNCNQVKFALRECALKNILNQLPSQHFVRLCRFYIINISRLKMGDSIHDVAKFSNGLDIKLTHPVSFEAWNSIGY